MSLLPAAISAVPAVATAAGLRLQGGLELAPRLPLAAALLLLGVACFATVAQLAMTRAYSRGKTLMSAALAYSTVIFSSLFGMLFWGEVMDAASWLAIDDAPGNWPTRPRLVLTDFKQGFTDEDAGRMRRMLDAFRAGAGQAGA